MTNVRKRLITLQNILESDNYQELFSELNGLIGCVSSKEKYLPFAQAIHSQSYEQAKMLLEELLLESLPPIKMEDVTVAGLKTTMGLLETRLSVLNHRKVELHRRINEFRFQHNNVLGSLMAEIFELRKNILFLELQDNTDLRQDFEEAEHDQQSFREQQEETLARPVINIDKASRAEMIALYRKASKLCHPDLISEELHHEATLLFIRLNECYLRSDISGIRDILRLLEDEQMQWAKRNVDVHEKDRLTASIFRIQAEMNNLLREIEEIETSSVYQTITSEEDLDTYFLNLKGKFEKERDALKIKHESRKSAHPKE